MAARHLTDAGGGVDGPHAETAGHRRGEILDQREGRPDHAGVAHGIPVVVPAHPPVAEGAALMTETSVDVKMIGACSSLLNNHYLADLHYQAMEEIGPIEYTDEEIALIAEYFATRSNQGGD